MGNSQFQNKNNFRKRRKVDAQNQKESNAGGKRWGRETLTKRTYRINPIDDRLNSPMRLVSMRIDPMALGQKDNLHMKRGAKPNKMQYKKEISRKHPWERENERYVEVPGRGKVNAQKTGEVEVSGTIPHVLLIGGKFSGVDS